MSAIVMTLTGPKTVPTIDEFSELKKSGEWLYRRILKGEYEEGVWQESPLLPVWRRLGDGVERLVLITARQIALKAHNGKYVSADLTEGKEGVMKAAWADRIGTWETFAVVDLGDGTIALLADNGKYIDVDADNGSVLKARVEQLEKCGRFRVCHQGDAGIALRVDGGMYVGADSNDGGVLKAWRPNDAQAREQFRWQAVPYEFSTQDHVASLIKNGVMKEEMDRILDEKLSLLDAKLAEAREILKKIEAAKA